ncbi:3-deoxy-7-phosphoheptulonate synthase [Vicingus serpentipes]|uniref:3-deoxy-7-phosphoheptulonate synthase n=1 Tax=Vicingus serpentipes TaxID=1926625 RepID=A0A5C6RQZ3_9FLAO|nr:3-deoxy-7-phosphoheptulonate synthase [Vicingus serpentipes]TXB64305.1 3-deoxy-7-phosphoheptulonate synthase [Vicingus serpentipes]
MIIQLSDTITSLQKDALLNSLSGLNIKSNEVKTQFKNYIIGIPKVDFDIRTIGNLDGIEDIHRVSDAYKLVSKKWKINRTIIDLGDDVTIGGNELAIMAGPCSIENEAQIENTVQHLLKNNIKIMRGGVYKPRSSPYAFRGLGMDGLKLFYKHCKENGIKVITEVMQVSQVEEMLDYVDVFQVGARNSQNFNLLDVLGEVDKPVLIKRGMSGTIEELLASAEYVFSNGNEKLLLCERGIRTYENAYRNTLDLNAIPILKEKSHLPVIVDPSHGIGLRQHVATMALAGVVAGADGIIIEVHEQPENAFSDGQQTLYYEQAEELYRKAKVLFQNI